MNSRRLHRTIGLIIALPLLLLIITGLPLQFPQALHLDTTPVNQAVIHRAYGIKAPTDAQVSGPAIVLENELFLGDRHMTLRGRFIGSMELEDLYLVFTDDALMIASADPSIPPETSPLSFTMDKVAISFDQNSERYLIAFGDQTYWRSDDLGLTWQPTAASQVDWIQVREVQAEPAWQHRFVAAQISWERFLLDLHSGRFFGAVGEYIMSAASLIMILLAITGILVWWRRLQR